MPTSQTFSFTIILAEKRNNVNKKARQKPPAGEGDGEVSSVPFTGVSPWIIMGVLLNPSSRKEVANMVPTLTNFIISVMASVAGYYICLVITFATQKQASPAAPSWAVS